MPRAPSDLHQFIDLLRREREVVEVEATVDPYLEMAEVHRRVIAADGPALLFRRPKGSDIAVATNLFGSQKRLELAFGGSPQHWVERAVDLIQGPMPPRFGELWRQRALLGRLARLGVRDRRRAQVAEVRSEPILTRLPVLTTWPRDGGPFLTLPNVLTEPPGGGAANLAIYRMQVFDDATTGMHWQIGKGGGFHLAQAAETGEPLPVTVFLGGPPAMTLAAVAPLPENVPEMLLASLVAGGKVPVWTPEGGHPVPATADVCLVGTVAPQERRVEGPFGDHYGYYSLEHEFPVFRATAMYRRRDAIYPATVVGKPRQEDYYLGDLLQEILSPLFPVVMPAVKSLWSYGDTGYHSLAAAVVRDRYGREALASGFRILGEGQLSLTKFLLLTDRDVDLKDFKTVLETVLERTRPETDLYVFAHTSMDTLDYAGPRINYGSKCCWLGLGDPVRELPGEFKGEPPPFVDEVRVFCSGCLVVRTAPKSERPEIAAEVAGAEVFSDWPLVVVTDDARRATAGEANFLWTTFTRLDPAQDLVAAESVLRDNHLGYRGPIVLDARLPADFPDELVCDDATGDLVDRRWKEYFPEGGVEMGDSDRAHLE